MRERPILFSAPMVRAILDGTKTQTRRVVKPVRGFEHDNILKYGMPHAADPWAVWWRGPETDRVGCLQECPYGKPGDRLWVKETWRPSTAHLCGRGECDCADVNVEYTADGETRYFEDDSQQKGDWSMPKAAKRGNVSPLFMPRWASRITLEITGVRVERVQDVNSDDSIAEGVSKTEFWKPKEVDENPKPTHEWAEPFWDDAYFWTHYPQRVYRKLWESINGAESWAANPYVWVIEFKRLEGC